MTETSNIRRERIERLLEELRYEISRGMLEHEIDEEIGFRFYVPLSQKIKDGVVFCEFRTRPLPRSYMSLDDIARGPRLTVVK